MLNGEQQAETESWQHTVAPGYGLLEYCHLVVDGDVLTQTKLVCNLGVLLDLQFLLKEQMAVMGRRTYA